MQGVFGNGSASTSAAGTADLTYASSAAAKPSPASAAARAGGDAPGTAGVLGELQADATPTGPSTARAQNNYSKATTPLQIRLSSTRYTDADLLKQAIRLAGDSSTDSLRPGAAEAVTIGPIGTPVGVQSCLTSLGLAASTRTVVDLANFDGNPAAVLVTTINGRTEARVVPRSCGAEGSSLLAGPLALP